MASVNSKGHSESWLAQKKNVVGIFDEWKGVGCKWEEVTEKQATDPSLYEAFATYLLYEYTFASGGGERKLLKGKNVRNYVYVLVHLAKDKFNAKTHDPATKLFFTCVDKQSNTDAAIWLRGIKKDIVRVTFEREKDAGTAGDANGKVCGRAPSYTRYYSINNY